MYLHLGQSVVVPFRDVVGIFDLDNTTASHRTRSFLTRAEKEGRVVNVSEDLPKSFVLCVGRDGRRTVYISQLSPATLLRRAESNTFDTRAPPCPEGGARLFHPEARLPGIPPGSASLVLLFPIPNWRFYIMSEELELNSTQVVHEYTGSEIQVLEGLEAVRKRPGMYIGSTSSSGLHHLVYEIVDNAIDEALAGYCDEISVTIQEGDVIRVTDNGRGIPVDIQPQTGKPALEVVFTILHAGGKFGGGGYKVSGGLHGVGASVVNALSEWLEVQVHKDGKIYEMKFSRGHVTQDMTVVGETDRHGTVVTFKPDPEMFEDTVYDYDILHTRMREEAFLNAGVRIRTADERTGQAQEDTMHYAGGIREFVTYINRNKTPLHGDVIYISGQKDDAMAEVAFQYNDGYNENIVSFANNVHTPEGGMHETGFKTALTRVLNNYGLQKGILKNDDKVSGEDCREGITCVISVKLTNAQFEGQTKAKLGNSEIRTLVDSIVSDRLAEYLEENPAVGRTILEKAMTANRFRRETAYSFRQPRTYLSGRRVHQ